MKWWQKAWHQISTFVRNLLFKVGLAATPEGPNYCLEPEPKIEGRVEADKALFQIHPAGVLQKNKNYFFKVINLKNKCGDVLTILPTNTLDFTTGEEICRLDNVAIIPVDEFVLKTYQNLPYEAIPQHGTQHIGEIPGVYEWFFDWSSTNTAIGFPVESEANDRHSDVRTFAENGQAVIRAKATISVDNLALNCANVNSGAVCVPNPADPDCQCTPDPKEEVTVGASYTGYGQLTVFICDNPWFSDIYDNSALPPAYKWDLTDPDNVNKKFDIKYAISNDGTLAPSYLVEKEFNAGLFYCRDFGAAGNFADDLPKIGLTAGAFTELDPVPRYGYYFDRHQDHVLVVTATDLDFMNDKTNSWTISTWVYNNDIPTDRYARVFYKNLDSAVSYEGTKDHVQLAFRRWGVGCDDLAGNACAWDYTSAGANPNSCDDSTCAFSRSLTYQIRNGSVNINKGIDNVNDLLQDGFNQITLSYNGAAEQAFLYVNGKDVDNLRDEQTSLYTWPRIDTEIDINGNRYDFMFIGGLGETDIPSVSLGGYMDDFRVYDQAKTPADILADPADHLLIGYDFDTQEKFSIPIEGSSSSSTGKNACTPDFAESQCVSSGVFKVHNLSQLALEEGLYGEDTSGWSELSADIFNQCSDGKDNDYNGLTDMADPKCKDDSDPWEEPAMMAQYFFVRKADTAFPDTNDNAADAISMRIFENPEHLPPDIWYQRYAPYSTSNLPIIESDCMTDDFGSYCYQAVQDGTSVYISAANINSTNVYNNIYLLSYSGNANQATVNIYNQLVQFMKFNMNILSDSMVNKYQLIRDDIRTTNFVVLREYIKLYKQTHQGKVPQLDGGTLQRHMTNSIWESWNKDFQNTLKSTVPGTSILKSRPFPVDPQNQLAFNPPSFKCSDPQGNTCLPDMDNCTCYQAAIKNEECGANDNGNVLYCYDDEQCVLPGFACIDCSDNFDSKYCYKGSNQSFSAKPDASGTSIPIYDLYSSKYYGYEANAADETEYKLTVKKETTLDYKVVPEYEEIAGGWESLKIEEEEALAAPTYASPTDLPQCMNGIDDDLNGLTDYPADPGCTDADGGATDALEYFEYDCRDGDDNDVDTKTDYCKADGSNADTCDPSCSDEFDNDEYNPPQCSDGVDNDEDGNCDLGDCVDADGNPLSADIGCVDAADNDESYRGLPNGKILFAFFADTSGSMSFVDRDPAMIHQDLIRGIIDGVGNINGIDDVLGEKAYYTLGTSHNGDVARKKYFPAGQKDHFLQWLDCSEGWLECPYGSAECLEKFNCGGAGLCEKSYCTENDQCSSGYCDPSGYNPNAVGTIKPGCGKKGPSGEEAPICSSPYIYNGSAYMPTRIQLTMQDSVAEVLPGHFEGMVYIVFTDADDLPSGCVDVDGIACTYGKENCLCEDTDEYIALNQTLDLANDNLIPIHFIYIRNVALPENSAKYQFYYNYYSGVNAKHRGVWLQGSIDFLENNLDDIVSAIAVPPAEVVEDTSEAGF
jgi:hypothetical protein